MRPDPFDIDDEPVNESLELEAIDEGDEWDDHLQTARETLKEVVADYIEDDG